MLALSKLGASNLSQFALLPQIIESRSGSCIGLNDEQAGKQ